MEWIAYCTVCGELDRAPNGPMMERAARLHRRDTGHTTIVGYEPAIAMSGEMVEVKIIEGPPGANGLPEQPPGRPVPQVYGDWVNLAEDIKVGDSSLASKVNYNLGLILHDLPGSEDAKRWLTRKAGELGIKG